MTTVTDLANQNQLVFRRGVYNIIDCGTRTGKTYWAVNHLKDYTRDGGLNRVLYLVDTNSLKDSILESYSEICADADIFWETPSIWGETTDKIGVMCYQGLGMKLIQGSAQFLENIDVICWDECDSIFDFAVAAFRTARQRDYNRKDKKLSNAEILSVIQTYSSTREYMPLILLGKWEEIVNEGRILCIGLSATKLQPEPGKGYWCYSPFIEPKQTIVNVAREQGFNPIELHSIRNEDKPMTEEQQRVYGVIVSTGMVPQEYDFVVINKALARGIDIKDRRFDNVIIDSYDAEDRIQVPRQTFQYQRHLKTLCSEIPDEYMNRWLTIPECRQLAELMAVPSLDKTNKNNSKIMTWNSLKDCLPMLGYTVEQKKKTIKGKQQQMCYITGEWHDAEIKDNDFLALVEAKEG